MRDDPLRALVETITGATAATEEVGTAVKIIGRELEAMAAIASEKSPAPAALWQYFYALYEVLLNQREIDALDCAIDPVLQALVALAPAAVPDSYSDCLSLGRVIRPEPAGASVMYLPAYSQTRNGAAPIGRYR
jgi:hypothetical protein